MRGKLLFVAGAAVGYVFGTRAGRQRYEQLRAGASKVWESPGVQKQVHALEDFVAEKIGEIPEATFTAVKKTVVRANARRRASRVASTAPASKTPASKASSSKASSSKPSAAGASARPADDIVSSPS